jgi:hygromycin-B 7''-O-kinase
VGSETLSALCLFEVSVLLPDVQTWTKWGQMFTDVAQWTPAVSEICRQEAISYRCIEAGYPGTNAVFILDQAWVVKIYAPFCREDFAHERELYPLLSRNPQIPVPCLRAAGILSDRIEWPYIIMDYLPGQPLREVRHQIDRTNRAEIGVALGQMVRELHRTPLQEIHSLNSSWDHWRHFRQGREASCVEELQRVGVLAAQVLDEVPAFLQSVLGAGRQMPLVLVNGDLTEDHILLRRQGGRWVVSGLIDLADSLIGEREYEWVAPWLSAFGLDGEWMRAFVQTYDPDTRLDDKWLNRALAFTFIHQFGALCIKDVLRGMGYPDAASLRQLRDLLWGGLAE